MFEKDNALDALFSKPAFASLNERQIEMLRQFAKEIDGKNPVEIAAKYFRFNRQLTKEQPLTPAQREAVSEAIKDSLPPEDRQRYEKILKLI